MTLRLGTFNLFQYIAPPYSYYVKRDKFAPDEFKQKKTWIKEQLLKMDAQIIGFQEVFSHDDLEALCRECGYEYYTKVDTPKHHENNDKILVTTTVALASKYPILNTQTVKLHVPVLKKHNFEGHFKFSRKPIKATIELPNKEQLIVYVCHLKSNRLNEFEYIFNESHSFEEKQKTIQKALKENYSPALKQRLCEASSLFFNIQKQKGPSVLMCDLNDKEFSMSIEAMCNEAYHKSNKKGQLLFDAYYAYKPKVYNPHPEAKPIKRKPTSYYINIGNVLDYIFISKQIHPHYNKNAQISAYEVFDEHLQENKDGSLLQSDHAPVVCEITLT